MSDTCRSCKAPIEWAYTERGRRMPVDKEPTPEGNITLSHREQGRSPIAIYNSTEQIEEKRKQAATRGEDARFFVSHFASCPYANKHRKKDRKAAAQA